MSLREAGTGTVAGVVPTSNARDHREIVLPHTGLNRARLQPSHRTPSPSVDAEIQEAARDADWIWLAVWPLNWSEHARKWRNEGRFVTWDEDALSRSRLTAARALAWRHPFRAGTRLIAGTMAAGAERRHLRHVSVVVARSPADLAWLARRQSAPVMLVRNAVDTARLSEVRQTSPVATTEREVLFVGSNYEPNVDGISWFVRAVWPEVSATHGDAHLTIVGRGLERYTQQWQSPSITVVGSTADTRPFVGMARVFVCPVFYGAGSQRKLLEAAAAARAIVASPFSASSTAGGKALPIARSASEWRARVCTFLASTELASEAGAVALKQVATLNDLVSFDKDFERLEELARLSQR